VAKRDQDTTPAAMPRNAEDFFGFCLCETRGPGSAGAKPVNQGTQTFWLSSNLIHGRLAPKLPEKGPGASRKRIGKPVFSANGFFLLRRRE